MYKIIILAITLAAQHIHCMESLVSNANQINNQEPITLVSKEGISFKLHKNFVNRSPVLKTMLASSMKEAKSSTVHLKDMDTNTLATIQLLLQVGETQRTNILQALVTKKNSNEIQSLTDAAHCLDIDELLKTRSTLPIIQEVCNNVLSVIEIPCKKLTGHSKAVRKIIIDDDYLINGSDDGSIRIWNKHTGQCLQELIGHGKITYLVMNDDYLISGCNLGSIRIWHKRSGKLLHELYGHRSDISGLIIDGDLLISGSDDKTIRIWNKNTGACTHILNDHEDTIKSIEIDGDYIISASRDGIRKWNKYTGECMKIADCCSFGSPNSIKYGQYSISSPVSNILHSHKNISIRIWNEKEGSKTIRQLGYDTNVGPAVKVVSSCLVDNDCLIAGYNVYDAYDHKYDNPILIWDLSIYKEFENFIQRELPIVYAKLLYQFDAYPDNAYAKVLHLFSDNDMIQKQEDLLNHFLETIQTNWGDKVMEVVKETLLSSVRNKQQIGSLRDYLPRLEFTLLGVAGLLALITFTKK